MRQVDELGDGGALVVDLLLEERRPGTVRSQARFQHPESPAMVWGRARTRLAKFALEQAPDALILARTDAWWMNVNLDVDYRAEMPKHLFLRRALSHASDPKPGDWREKEHLAGPLAAPRDTGEALRLMRQARGKLVEKGDN